MGPSQKESTLSHYYATSINQPIRVISLYKNEPPGSIENPLAQKLGRGNGE